ncbi:hypothetical protein CC86DRAFT_41642 [Ophiobolus disseminans]|uniref:Uncharacterized protein n=1 Tax=Ophiobolus disseminans TaxID=1469910 RepID=A0A6A6ZW53_9PLEO|nr:hypothetical protein CC86DRAFT_41642 [Ophiobolus disseminans]
MHWTPDPQQGYNPHVNSTPLPTRETHDPYLGLSNDIDATLSYGGSQASDLEVVPHGAVPAVTPAWSIRPAQQSVYATMNNAYPVDYGTPRGYGGAQGPYAQFDEHVAVSATTPALPFRPAQQSVYTPMNSTTPVAYGMPQGLRRVQDPSPHFDQHVAARVAMPRYTTPQGVQGRQGPYSRFEQHHMLQTRANVTHMTAHGAPQGYEGIQNPRHQVGNQLFPGIQPLLPFPPSTQTAQYTPYTTSLPSIPSLRPLPNPTTPPISTSQPSARTNSSPALRQLHKAGDNIPPLNEPRKTNPDSRGVMRREWTIKKKTRERTKKSVSEEDHESGEDEMGAQEGEVRGR